LHIGCRFGISGAGSLRSCEKIAEKQKTKNALQGNQRIANANFGGFQFFHSF